MQIIFYQSRINIELEFLSFAQFYLFVIEYMDINLIKSITIYRIYFKKEFLDINNTYLQRFEIILISSRSKCRLLIHFEY